MVNPLSNEYHALMDHYQAQQRNAPSLPEQQRVPQPQVAQQPHPQPQMVQQTLTQMMRTSQPQQQENLLNNMAAINSIQGIAQRVRDQQQNQEQKFSNTPEFQFKF